MNGSISDYVLESFFSLLLWFERGGLAPVIFVLILVLATHVACAFWLQQQFKVLRQQAARRAGQRDKKKGASKHKNQVSWPRLFWAEVISMPMLAGIGLVFLWPILIVAWFFKKIITAIRTKIKSEPSEAALTETPEDLSAEATWLAASLGPSYLYASLIAFGLLISIEMIVKPIAGAQEHIPSVEHAINALLFGKIPMAGPLVSMVATPRIALLLSGLFWIFAWSSIARFVRLIAYPTLRRLEAQAPGTRFVELNWWRERLGIRRFVRPDDSFLQWANWLTGILGVLAVILVLFASVRGIPLRGASFWVGLILVVGWILHITLRGDASDSPASAPETTPSKAKLLPDWSDVEAQLLHVHGTRKHTAGRTRTVQARTASPTGPSHESPLSPLFGLDPEDFGPKSSFRHVKLSRAQSKILAQIHGAVRQDLAAGASKENEVRATGLRMERKHTDPLNDARPKLHVSAPLGAGKSTLAQLAAVNHVLRTGQRALIVASSKESKDAHIRDLDDALRSSPMRWAVSYVGAHNAPLVGLPDAATPDIVVCTLDWIALHLLPDQSYHKHLLDTLSLLILDDAQHYIGPHSEHAGLVFKRLRLALERTTASLGGTRAPTVLTLDNNSAPAARRATEKVIGYPLDAFAIDADDWLITAGSNGASALEGKQEFRYLDDFRDQRDVPLTLANLIDACEQKQVPWCRRQAGDDIDNIDGESLSDGYASRKDNPLDAAVVFLVGRITHIESSLRDLRFAGSRYISEQSDPDKRRCVFVLIADADERMAFELRAQQGSIAALMGRLPIPDVRPPGIERSEAHLAAEFKAHELELDQIRGLCGSDYLLRVRELVGAERLLVRSTADIHPNQREFVPLVYVRATGRSFRNEERGETTVDYGGKRIPLLHPPIVNLDPIMDQPTRIYDRNAQRTLRQVDPLSARFSFYPDAIFTEGGSDYSVHREGTLRPNDTNITALPHIISSVVSIPERRLTWAFAPLTQSDDFDEATTRWSKRAYGRDALRTAFARILVRGDHLATRRVHRTTFVFDERLTPDDRLVEGFYSGTPSTTALLVDLDGLLPDTTSSPDNASVDESILANTRRFLNATARMCIGLLYPEATPPIDVSLMAPEEIFTQADRSDGDTPPNHALVFFDTLESGSGVVETLHREGLKPILQLMRLVAERILHHERILQRYSDEPLSSHRSEVMASTPAEIRDREAVIRRTALTWLNRHLAAEDGGNLLPSGSSYPSGHERGDSLGDIGRTWIAASLGVTDLRWSRLHWRETHGDTPRALDFAISGEFIKDINKEQRGSLTSITPPPAAAPVPNETPTTSAEEQPEANIEGTFVTFPIERHGFDVIIPDAHGVPSTPPPPGLYPFIHGLKKTIDRLSDDQLPLLESLVTLFNEWAHDELESPHEALLVEYVQLASSILAAKPDEAILPIRPAVTDAPLTINGPALALHNGSASDLSAALLLASLQAQRDLPAGIFMKVHEDQRIEFVGAIYTGTAQAAIDGEHPPEILAWRERWMATPGSSQRAIDRLVRKPAVSINANGHRILAVDLRRPRELSLVSRDDTATWFYLPLTEPA